MKFDVSNSCLMIVNFIYIVIGIYFKLYFLFILLIFVREINEVVLVVRKYVKEIGILIIIDKKLV